MSLLLRRHALLKRTTFIDQAVFNDHTDTNHVLTFPFVPAEGTLMLCYLPFYIASPAPSAPSGWAQITAPNNILAEPADYYYYKIAGASESNSYNFSTASPSRVGMCGLTFNVYNTTAANPWATPVKATTGAGTSNTINTGNFNVAAGSQVLIFYTKGGSPSTITSITNGFTGLLGIPAFGVRHKFYPVAATGENCDITWNTATGRNRTMVLQMLAAA